MRNHCFHNLLFWFIISFLSHQQTKFYIFLDMSLFSPFLTLIMKLLRIQLLTLHTANPFYHFWYIFAILSSSCNFFTSIFSILYTFSTHIFKLPLKFDKKSTMVRSFNHTPHWPMKIWKLPFKIMIIITTFGSINLLFNLLSITV